MKSLAKLQLWIGRPARERDAVAFVLLELRGAKSPLTSKDLVRRLAPKGIPLARVRRALAMLEELHLASWRAEWVSQFGYRRAWTPKTNPSAIAFGNAITHPGAFLHAGVAAGLIGPGARFEL